MSRERGKDAYFTRNVCGVAAVEFCWGLGFPIVLESTFLQLFLQQLGASSLAIGSVPSIFIFGISCFPLFASYLSQKSRMKKKIVLALHLLSALSIFLFGWTLLMVREAAILPLFFASYVIFSLCMGLTIPVWLNYIVRIFSERKAVQGIGYMMLFQNIGKIISSFFILKVVEKYAFSIPSCSMVFVITGGLFIIGSLCFAFTKELVDSDDPDPDTAGFIEHIRVSLKEILGNKPFLIFLIADLDFFIILTLLSFYANYAHLYFGVNQAVAAGAFVGCIYAGSITVNILLGTMGLLQLKSKFILSKCLSLLTLALLIAVPANWFFFLISYLLGVVRAIRNMVYTPSVKKLSKKTDATPYFAFAPVLTLPVGVGFPLLFGKLIDLNADMGAGAYRILFGVAALLILVTFYFTLKTDYDEEKE